jgi:hypothetical protein
MKPNFHLALQTFKVWVAGEHRILEQGMLSWIATGNVRVWEEVQRNWHCYDWLMLVAFRSTWFKSELIKCIEYFIQGAQGRYINTLSAIDETERLIFNWHLSMKLQAIQSLWLLRERRSTPKWRLSALCAPGSRSWVVVCCSLLLLVVVWLQPAALTSYTDKARWRWYRVKTLPKFGRPCRGW